jgi:SAM-dependent methyltransferase
VGGQAHLRRAAGGARRHRIAHRRLRRAPPDVHAGHRDRRAAARQQGAGLTFARGDLTNLAGLPTASVASLSCLHTIEHVGLGRYGDAIDPDGWSKALRELVRVLQAGGRLYLSVPIGAERLVFNAHRYFSPRTILDALPELRLQRFDAVDDAGDLRVDAPLDGFDAARDSCGIFELTKA